MRFESVVLIGMLVAMALVGVVLARTEAPATALRDEAQKRFEHARHLAANAELRCHKASAEPRCLEALLEKQLILFNEGRSLELAAFRIEQLKRRGREQR